MLDLSGKSFIFEIKKRQNKQKTKQKHNKKKTGKITVNLIKGIKLLSRELTSWFKRTYDMESLRRRTFNTNWEIFAEQVEIKKWYRRKKPPGGLDIYKSYIPVYLQDSKCNVIPQPSSYFIFTNTFSLCGWCSSRSYNLDSDFEGGYKVSREGAMD